MNTVNIVVCPLQTNQVILIEYESAVTRFNFMKTDGTKEEEKSFTIPYGQSSNLFILIQGQLLSVLAWLLGAQNS